MTHTHTFDSKYGSVLGRMGLALACRCGAWGMPAGGEWHAVPVELLPAACRSITRLRTAGRVVRDCVLSLAIGFIVALWLV